LRKIILSIPITLDGYIEGSHRELDWVTADDEMHDYFTEVLRSVDMMIFGRVAYELLASYWPTAPSDPNITRGMLEFANTINPLPKIVYSRTLEKVGWNTRVLKSFIPEEIRQLKAQSGGNIALSGGASIAQQFIQHGLVDEFQLVIQPAVIGKGKSLFGGITNGLKMELVWEKTLRSGTVALCYRPDGMIRGT